MKVPTTCLLIAALFIVPAQTQNITHCYFCYVATEVQDCNEVKTCRAGFEYCRTVTLSANTGYPFVSGSLLVTRDCVMSCENSDLEDLGSESEVYCCKGNLCNSLYEAVANLTSPGVSTYRQHSGVYGELIVSVSIFSLLLPSWV